MDRAIQTTARSRACRFSAARPSSPGSASSYASTSGAIRTVRRLSPVRRACSAASDWLCSVENALGFETPCTLSAPIASHASWAHTVESMPPDIPSRTLLKPFLRA